MSNYKLELYVESQATASQQAIECVTEICDTYLSNRYSLEVIDVARQPGKAEKAHILTTPTLIKTAPLPVRRLIGGLTVKSRILAGLDIPFEEQQ